MLVTNPKGNLGIICDDCSLVVVHEIVEEYLLTHPSVFQCNSCKKKAEKK